MCVTAGRDIGLGNVMGFCGENVGEGWMAERGGVVF